jgi:hypothetical protein
MYESGSGAMIFQVWVLIIPGSKSLFDHSSSNPLVDNKLVNTITALRKSDEVVHVVCSDIASRELWN